jgi:hypothetical protein
MTQGFSFGGVRQSSSKKDVKRTRFNYVLKEKHANPDFPEFLILVDYIPDDKTLSLLSDDVDKVLSNYVIASAVNTHDPREADVNVMSGTAAGAIDLKYVLSNESEWRALLKKHEFSAVLALGSGLYAAQKSTDTLPQDYLDDAWHEPRCFLSEEFVNGGDLFYYPSFGLDDVYPLKDKRLGAQAFDFVNYRTRFFRSQLERMRDDDKDPKKSLDMRSYEIEVVSERERADEVLKSMMDSELFAHDTETSGFNPWLDKLGCVTFTNDGLKGYYVPWDLVNTRLFSKVLLSAKKNVMVNAKFDFKFYWLNGVSKKCQCTDDTMLLAHAINSSRPKGLKPNAIFDTKLGGYDLELDRARKELKLQNYLDIPVKILSKYAVLDSIVTWRLYKKLIENVRRIDQLYPNEKDPNHTIEWWYDKVMMPTYLDFIELEFEGAYLDEWELTKYRKILDEEIEKLEDELKRTWNAPKSLDLKSTKKLGEFIEHTLKWPITHRSKDESASTSDDALIDWEVRGMPGIKTLKQFRSLQMGRNMFLGYRENGSRRSSFGEAAVDRQGFTVSGWEQFILRHCDGTLRMHPNFNVFGTETFRNRCMNPNLQQLPSRGKLSTLVEPVLTCPTKIRYTVKSGHEVLTGYGNDLLQVKRGMGEYEVTFSQLEPDDEVIGLLNRSASPDVVIQDGSLGPKVRTFMRKIC